MNKILEALRIAEDEKDMLALELGFVISERVGEHGVDKAVENLKSQPFFKKTPDRDLRDLVDYLVAHRGESVAFSPDLLDAFFTFAKNIGFPTTLGGAEKANLKTVKYKTEVLLNLLVGVKVLTLIELKAKEVLDYAKHHSEEDKYFRENPDKPVEVYELHPEFVKELRYLLRDLKVKEESITDDVRNRIKRIKTEDMAPTRFLMELESKLSLLS